MKLKVLSYNVHKGFSILPEKFTLHQIRKAIRETHADVCFLQEVVGENQLFQNSIQDWPTQPQFEFLADTIWPHYSYGKNAVFPKRHHGNAILSKFPIVKEHNLNISTNRFEQRGLLHCQLEIPGTGEHLDLFNTHLNLFHNSRAVQVEKICANLAKWVGPQDPLILAGDFNDWTYKLSEPICKNLGVVDAFVEGTGKPAKTFPSRLPLLPLDRIYSRNLKVIDQQVLNWGEWPHLSDHVPLYVEFDLD